MTVEDIKDYIDSDIETLNNIIKFYEEEKSSRTRRTNKSISIVLELVKDFKYEFEKIKSMLDELEDNKNIKAKPIFLKSDSVMIPRCPRCHHALLLRQDEYKCSECGKEIDWSRYD